MRWCFILYLCQDLFWIPLLAQHKNLFPETSHQISVGYIRLWNAGVYLPGFITNTRFQGVTFTLSYWEKGVERVHGSYHYYHVWQCCETIDEGFTVHVDQHSTAWMAEIFGYLPFSFVEFKNGFYLFKGGNPFFRESNSGILVWGTVGIRAGKFPNFYLSFDLFNYPFIYSRQLGLHFRIPYSLALVKISYYYLLPFGNPIEVFLHSNLPSLFSLKSELGKEVQIRIPISPRFGFTLKSIWKKNLYLLLGQINLSLHFPSKTAR